MSPNELNGGRIFDDKYQPQWQISLGPDEWWINSAGGHEGERRKIKCVKYKIEHYKHLPVSNLNIPLFAPNSEELTSCLFVIAVSFPACWLLGMGY